MCETFTFTPTAYDVARAKQQSMTPKQLKREGQREMKKACGQFNQNHPTATQYNALLKIQDTCAEYGLEVPLWMKWFILLHKATYESSHCTRW